MSKKSTREVVDRIKQVYGIENKTGSDARLCEAIDLNRQTLSSWLSRDSVPYALCVQISEEKDVNLDWLITGNGVMSKSTASEVAEETVYLYGKLKQRHIAVLRLFDALPEDKQSEIMSTLADKKRIIDLEEHYKELKRAVEAIKNTG